ncbi:MAG: hypothetical protein WD182_04140, partial [Bacteroidota bacterium]
WSETGIVVGSFCWFFFLFLIFAKTLPVVSMWEVKEQLDPPMSGSKRATGQGGRGAGESAG